MDIAETIKREELIKEAVYAGNLGAVEMIQFYQKATDEQIKKMEKLINKNSWIGVKKLIKFVLGIELK